MSSYEASQPHPNLLKAQEAESIIRGALAKNGFPSQESIDYCVRPMKELRVREEEVRKMPAWQRGVPQTDLMYGSSTDAIALYYATAHAFTYRSHRFTFHNDGHIAYHREAYNTDPQCIASPPVNLGSVQEIAAEPSALKELLAIEDCFRNSTEQDWHRRKGRVAIQAC